MINSRYIIILFTLAVCLASCDITDNEAVPTESFFKIYDNNAFDASFIPIDITQTSDGGYIVLSSSRLTTSNFTGVNLVRLDENGEFISETLLDEQYVNPVDQIVELENNYYFMAMNSISLEAVLFNINDSAAVQSTTPLGITYPMYLNADGGNLLTLSYNNSSKNTILSVISPEGQTIGTRAAFDIGAGADTEAPIISHFNRTGRQLPFFAGRIEGGPYYFNGFFNYTLSLVFTNLDETLGVVQGQQDDGGLSAGIPVSSGNFAVARFNFGDNFIGPSVSLSTTETISSTDILDNPFPELVDNAPVILDVIEVNGTQSILYGSNTKSGQIILMAYEIAGSESTLMGTKYLGSTYPYEIAGFTQTVDGGLAVVGNTSVAGRFDRICMFKLSANELSELVN